MKCTRESPRSMGTADRIRTRPQAAALSASIWLMVVWCAGGATCYRQTVKVDLTPMPHAFEQTPTLDELAEVLNRTDGIGQLSSNSVSVEVPSMENVPRLSATLAIDRPRRFRMRASLPLMLGSGLDLGSNDEIFWFQIPEAMTQTLYFARHDQYRSQSYRSILPVDPTWLSDALGLVHLEPAEVVEGPITRSDGRLEVRTMMPMVDGLYSRVLIVEPQKGYVTDQILYGPDGRQVAAASGSSHRYYEQHGCALPHAVHLRLVPIDGPPLELKLAIGSYAVNQFLSADPTLFAMPQDAGRQVDLLLMGPGGGAAPAPPSTAAVRSAWLSQQPETPPITSLYR